MENAGFYRCNSLTTQARSTTAQPAAGVSVLPLISVLIPVYNPSPAWLRAAIESMRSQLYPHWELCIADDASPSDEVRRILKEYSESDERIKVVFRPENGHISAASNSALALMDHEDLLAENALVWVADCISARSGCAGDLFRRRRDRRARPAIPSKGARKSTKEQCAARFKGAFQGISE